MYRSVIYLDQHILQKKTSFINNARVNRNLASVPKITARILARETAKFSAGFMAMCGTNFLNKKANLDQTWKSWIFFRNTGQFFWIHAKILTQPRFPYMIPHCFHCTLDTANLAVQVTRFDRNPPTLCNIAPKVYNAGCCKGNLGIVKICRSIYLIYIFLWICHYYIIDCSTFWDTWSSDFTTQKIPLTNEPRNAASDIIQHRFGHCCDLSTCEGGQLS